MPAKLRKSRSRNNNRLASKQSRNRKTPKGKGKSKSKKTSRRRSRRGGANGEEDYDRFSNEVPDKDKVITEAIKKKYFSDKTDVSDEELKQKLIDILIRLPLLQIKRENPQSELESELEIKKFTDMCREQNRSLANNIKENLGKYKYDKHLSAYMITYLDRKYKITCVNANLSDDLVQVENSKFKKDFEGKSPEELAVIINNLIDGINLSDK